MEITAGNKRAVIVGASGLVGGHCLDYLLAHKAYNVVVSLGRKKLDITSNKLVQEIVDFDKYDTYANLIKGNDLYICLGTTMSKAGSKEAFRLVDYNYIVNVAKAGSANNMNQLMLVSSVGAEKSSFFFYNQVKGDTEEAIKKLSFWATHIFQPSILLGHRPESRVGESLAKVIGKGLDKVLGGLLSKYRPVEGETVAKAMVAVAQNLEAGIHIYPSNYLNKLADKEDELRKKLERQ
jgi:uncharacterized protein YbjT (DUF2867 family)